MRRSIYAHVFRVLTEGKQMPLVLSQSVLWRSNQHLVIDPAGNQGRWFVGGFERFREFARIILVSRELKVVIFLRIIAVCSAKHT